MPPLTLVIGNKRYSSWSLRPWLALEHVGVPFKEVVIPLDRPETAAEIAHYSPSGRVPALHDGDLVIWDSLAICEYLAEAFPNARLWPAAREARAVARAVSAEMHAGFQALREQMTMNVLARKDLTPTPAALADVARIRAIWRDCRARFGGAGPWLFGQFSIADAMYAPVVTRFRTYGVTLDGPDGDYADHVWESPLLRKWVDGARVEGWTVEKYERG